MKKHLHNALFALGCLMIFIASLSLCALRWAFATWANLNMDEIVYHMTTTIDGVDKNIIISFLLTCLLPAIVLTVVYALLFSRKKRKWIAVLASFVFLCASLVFSFFYANNRLNLTEWVKLQGEYSTFIPDNYADPAQVSLTFPEKKRNLIYIFLESMENTYADSSAGGAMPENYIPELTQLALENENFSGDANRLNGGVQLTGTGWTIAGMFAESSGLPLKITIDEHSMNTQREFFPDLTVLGDVLAGENYNQMLLIGSDATFGGRRLYYTDHGNFTIRDYPYAKDAGWIPMDYCEYWGFEDDKLFTYAREQALELAAQDQPFNLTLLTVDTHFEDGNTCEYCRDDFGNNQYANVFACSSRQVADFVSWVQEQDFYENTTIVLMGDHLTMDSDFCKEVDKNYPRTVYTAYINAAATPEDPSLHRTYSTFDAFPTTLAALGVKIEGNRLGLGANLFSTEPTIVEKYDIDHINTELSKRSEFMENTSKIFNIAITNSDWENKKLSLHIGDFNALEAGKLEITFEHNEKTHTLYSKRVRGSVEAQDLLLSFPKKLDFDQQITLSVRLVGKSSTVDMFSVTFYPLSLINDINTYLDVLLERRDQYTVLVAAMDDVSSVLLPEVRWRFDRLGLRTNLAGIPRMSYCAISMPDQTLENHSSERLTLEGTLPNGKECTVISANYTAGNTCSIIVDGSNHVAFHRGYNITVYDHVFDRIIDCICYDTHTYSIAARVL